MTPWQRPFHPVATRRPPRRCRRPACPGSTWRVEATFRRCLAEFRDREDDCIATLRDSPVDTWGKRVHRLKGSALVLAMPEVVAQAQALELALQQGASAEALGRGLDGLEAALRPTLGVIDDLLRQD